MLIQEFLAPFWYLYLILVILAAIGLVVLGLPRKISEDGVSDYNPHTLVMVPCRGMDYSLMENLVSIRDQEYENFEVIAIVDDEQDPSIGILDEAGIRHITSSFECSGCSGKTRALSTALREMPDYQVYVIADSDTRVSPLWLRHIVSPLGNSNFGLSTTFPYFNPVGGFWSKVKAVWGIVGQSLMESELTRFGWGGSLAFRKELLDYESFERFSGSVSDDTALSTICSEKGLKIHYSRKAQPTIDSPDDFSTFFEWANRQTALSISASPKVFRYGLVVYVSMILVFLSAIVLSILDSPLFLVLFVPTVLSVFNNARRSRRKFPLLFVITAIMPFLFLTNLLVANSMSEIKWRGRTYRLQKQ